MGRSTARFRISIKDHLSPTRIKVELIGHGPGVEGLTLTVTTPLACSFAGIARWAGAGSQSTASSPRERGANRGSLDLALLRSAERTDPAPLEMLDARRIKPTNLETG